jgi:membrane protein DedA with SNARE-associated domain/rhodanese-related sulfurtransferase
MPIAIVFFVHYAYGILFLWVLVEQLGIPIPSIPVLLTAGTLSATHKVHASYALLVVLLACMIADSVWYVLGRRYGGSILRLLCRLSLEASTCVAKTEGYFSRRGPVTLLFAKFVPGLSTVAAPIAGQSGMPYGRFFLYDLAGSIIWAEAYLLAGRFFGDVAQKSEPFFHLLSRFAFVLFILMVLGFMAYRLFKQRRFLTQVRAMRIEPTELKEMMDKASAAGNIAPFLVDLRHPLDYLPDPRVLPGSIRIGPGEIAKRNGEIPRDRDVILYCTCPNEETSAKVAFQLQKLGVYRVRPLHEGFDGWKYLGYPLVDYVEPVRVAETVAAKLISAI